MLVSIFVFEIFLMILVCIYSLFSFSFIYFFICHCLVESRSIINWVELYYWLSQDLLLVESRFTIGKVENNCWLNQNSLLASWDSLLIKLGFNFLLSWVSLIGRVDMHCWSSCRPLLVRFNVWSSQDVLFFNPFFFHFCIFLILV